MNLKKIVELEAMLERNSKQTSSSINRPTFPNTNYDYEVVLILLLSRTALLRLSQCRQSRVNMHYKPLLFPLSFP